MNTEPSSPARRVNRATVLAAMARESLDLLVIGGGINGAGIAREAALRGLRVALIDKGDFASGTSSRSSKLIHGGLRYLELGDLRLVFSACQERDLLRRRLAPHLVRPMPFVFPVYAGDPHGLLAIRTALWLYDLLAAFRNIQRHRHLSRQATIALEPALRRDGLRGAGFYYDCWTNDARLTLENVLSARREGALVANYVELVGFDREDGRVAGARLRDAVSGDEFVVRAAAVVNATGPWLDVVRRLDDPAAAPVLRLTKGAHIVVPRTRIHHTHGLAVRAPADGRMMFVLPWGDRSLVGTTDTDHHGGPDGVHADGGDVDYLLDAVNYHFPAAQLGRTDVVSAFAGLRPLVAPASNGVTASSVSREESVILSPSGLVSLAGGKLTTYRRVAITVVNLVIRTLRRHGDRRPFPKSRTHQRPLVGADRSSAGPGRFDHGSAPTDHLAARYGARLAELAPLLDGHGALGRPLVPPLGDLRGEVPVAVAAEMALRIEDVLRRRLDVSLLDAAQGVRVANDVAALMAETLGWDEDRRRAEARGYADTVARERHGWSKC